MFKILSKPKHDKLYSEIVHYQLNGKAYFLETVAMDACASVSFLQKRCSTFVI